MKNTAYKSFVFLKYWRKRLFRLKEIKIKRWKIFSDGGNFILLKMEPEIKKNLIKHLLKTNIFVRDYGHIEGMEGYLRLTISTRKQMGGFVEKLRGFDNA